MGVLEGAVNQSRTVSGLVCSIIQLSKTVATPAEQAAIIQQSTGMSCSASKMRELVCARNRSGVGYIRGDEPQTQLTFVAISLPREEHEKRFTNQAPHNHALQHQHVLYSRLRTQHSVVPFRRVPQVDVWPSTRD